MAFITLSSINTGIVPIDDNWALQYLRLLFGPQLLGMQSDGYIPLLVLVSGALAPLYLSILLFMFMYIGGQGVVKTAMEGEFLGRRWNSIGVPAVMMLCVILLTPVPSQNGVCMGQYLYVRILKLGSNLADIIMVTTTNADKMTKTKTNVLDDTGKAMMLSNVVDRRLSGFMPVMICSEELLQAGFNKRTDYPALLKDVCKVPGEMLNYFGAPAEPATQNYNVQYKQEIFCYKQAFDELQLKHGAFVNVNKTLELYKSKIGPAWRNIVDNASICMVNGLKVTDSSFFSFLNSRPTNHGWASFANFGSQLNDASATYEAQFDYSPVPIIDTVKLGSSTSAVQTRNNINTLVSGFNATAIPDRQNAMRGVLQATGRSELSLNNRNGPANLGVATVQASVGIIGAYKFLDRQSAEMYKRASDLDALERASNGADLGSARAYNSANKFTGFVTSIAEKPGRMLQSIGDLGRKFKTAFLAWKSAKIAKTAAAESVSGIPGISGIAKAANTLMDVTSVMIDIPAVQTLLMAVFWLMAAAPLLPNVIFALAIFLWLVRCATWFLAIPLATLIVAIPETNVGHSSWREALALALTPAVMVIIYIVSLMSMDLLISILFDGMFSVYIDKGTVLGIANFITDLFTGEALVRLVVFLMGMVIGLIFTSTFILKGADWLFNTIGLRGAHSDLGEMGQLQEKVTSRLMGVSKIL